MEINPRTGKPRRDYDTLIMGAIFTSAIVALGFMVKYQAEIEKAKYHAMRDVGNAAVDAYRNR